MNISIRPWDPGEQEPHHVDNHYERWPFPDCHIAGREGMLLLKHLREWLTQSSGHRLRFIDVGCGTGHGTMAIARHFPEVEFLGVDVSTRSLATASEVAATDGLSNVVFSRLDVTKDAVSSLGTFDVVMCTGVLHHIAEESAAFATLLRLLAHDGYLVLWLYGQYGRLRHTLNQAFLQTLSGQAAPDDKFRVAREFIEQLGHRTALDSGFYTPEGSGVEGLRWLTEHDQWLADQMIPPYEHAYTMTEILTLFDSHEVTMHRWLGVPTDLRQHTSSELLLNRFAALSERQQLIAIDYLIKPEYYFVVGRCTALNRRNR